MSFNLTTSGAISAKAGYGVNSDVVSSGGLMAAFCDGAEGEFCVLTRKDWVGSPTTSARISGAIYDAVSDLAGMKAIAWDMSGYTSRAEAQTMLNVLFDNAKRIIDNLKEDTNKTFN